MRLLRLHLNAFGPFTDRVLEFGPAGQRLILIHGPNEAGKSSTLRAITDLRFGIPQQSADNFVHAHRDMRIGGVFIDAQGAEHPVLRRKGRGATLLHADFGDGDPVAGEPVPVEFEARLSCGLSRDEYEKGFAIDHGRLRQGGRDLLEGKGEIGATLFEASAGVRSIAQILERLEQSARHFFMPGARGKNARINAALGAWSGHHGAFRQALVRPALWTELSRKHQAAAAELAGLEKRHRELQARLLLIRELRAVAPLLAALDQASQRLCTLQAAPLLASDAASERVAAESGLASARRDAALAAAEHERQRQRLAALSPDLPILAIAPAVKRLAAAAESIDRHRADRAEAIAALATESECVARLAARIDATAPVAAMLAQVPAPVARAGIEERLRSVEHAQRAFDQQREAIARHTVDAQDPVEAATALPAPAARAALRFAQSELARNDSMLQRLAMLPAQIKAAQRAVATSLAQIGLGDENNIHRMRPLLDAQIDEAISARRASATRREEHDKRIEQLTAALAAAVERRERVLDRGAVPSFAEVGAARSRRDAGWALVRATYVEATIEAANPSIDGFAGARPLPQVYEEAVAEADRLADALAADHERAAELQSSTRAIAELERDRGALLRELAEIADEEAAHLARWERELTAAGLPALSPTALRDWQAQLARARTASEALQALGDELEQAQPIERRHARNLRVATIDTGLAAPPADAHPGTLTAAAAEIEQMLGEHEKRLANAAGRRAQREEQQHLMARRESELAEALHQTRAALAPLLGELHLPPDTSIAVTRARLDEFDELLLACDRRAVAESNERRARQALAVLDENAQAIAMALGEPRPADMRMYIERISARLTTAEETAQALALVEQALASAAENQARYERNTAEHETALAGLCMAAGVEAAALLPQAEEQSRRRREAQSRLDEANSQLALASRRPVDQLRTLLQNQDAAAMDAEEAASAQAQTQIEDELAAARQHEEAARHALQAIDGTDAAAAAREAMERAAARVRGDMQPWIRSRIARALLAEAMKRFRDRAQGPMLQTASACFERMTGGEFTRLVTDDGGVDDQPVLVAERANGSLLRVEGMSEGTLDQLFLALRLAALQLRRDAGIDLPVILDDVLMTSDERRAGLMLKALAGFARDGQVIVFSHHRHLVDIARASLDEAELAVVSL